MKREQANSPHPRWSSRHCYYELYWLVCQMSPSAVPSKHDDGLQYGVWLEPRTRSTKHDVRPRKNREKATTIGGAGRVRWCHMYRVTLRHGPAHGLQQQHHTACEIKFRERNLERKTCKRRQKLEPCSLVPSVAACCCGGAAQLRHVPSKTQISEERPVSPSHEMWGKESSRPRRFLKFGQQSASVKVISQPHRTTVVRS